MNKYTIIFYMLIVAVAIISSVLKKAKKANSGAASGNKKPYQQPNKTQTYQKPNNQQPKSLEDILQSLLNEQKPITKTVQQAPKTPVVGDKQLVKSTTDEIAESLETMEEQKYYALDTELNYNKELEDYDIITDHHVHGTGFDKIEEVIVEQENEWSNIDWRKAVITAEILRRPQY